MDLSNDPKHAKEIVRPLKGIKLNEEHIEHLINIHIRTMYNQSIHNSNHKIEERRKTANRKTKRL